jgi:hypothetical protein
LELELVAFHLRIEESGSLTGPTHSTTKERESKKRGKMFITVIPKKGKERNKEKGKRLLSRFLGDR